MAGSTLGNIFKITTWGESHGKALGVVVDGCPAGLPLSEEDIQKYLDRRNPAPVPLPLSVKRPIRWSFSPASLKGRLPVLLSP